jgi:hypothetical protein
MKGAQEGGWMGGLVGLGKGVGGAVFKPAGKNKELILKYSDLHYSAGLVGIPGYAFKGIYEEVRTTQTSATGKDVVEAQMVQGFKEWEAASDKERNLILLSIKRQIEDIETLEG